MTIFSHFYYIKWYSVRFYKISPHKNSCYGVVTCYDIRSLGYIDINIKRTGHLWQFKSKYTFIIPTKVRCDAVL